MRRRLILASPVHHHARVAAPPYRDDARKHHSVPCWKVSKIDCGGLLKCTIGVGNKSACQPGVRGVSKNQLPHQHPFRKAGWGGVYFYISPLFLIYVFFTDRDPNSSRDQRDGYQLMLHLSDGDCARVGGLPVQIVLHPRPPDEDGGVEWGTAGEICDGASQHRFRHRCGSTEACTDHTVHGHDVRCVDACGKRRHGDGSGSVELECLRRRALGRFVGSASARSFCWHGRCCC